MSIMYCESTQPKTPLLLARYKAGKGASNTWFLIWAYIGALTRVIPRLKLDNRAMWCQIMPSIMCPITRRRKNRSMNNPLSPLSLGFCKNDKSVTNPYNNIYGIIMLLFFP